MYTSRPDHLEQLAQALLQQKLLGLGHDLGRPAIGVSRAAASLPE